MPNDDRIMHSAFRQTDRVRWYIDPATGAYVPVVRVDGGEVDLAAGAEVELVDPTGVYLRDTTGANVGVKMIDGKLRTINQPYLYAISEGDVADHYAVRRFGFNSDVGTSYETVSYIGALMHYPAAALTLRVRSNDVDDDGDPADTGARTLWLQGLDANYAIQNETITMDGTTAVATSKAYIRLLKMKVVTAGTSLANEGTITCYDNTNTFPIMAISPLTNESHSASYTVPAGQTFYMTYWYGSEASLKGSRIQIFAQETFGELMALKRTLTVLDNVFTMEMGIPMVFGEKTDIEVRAIALAAGAIVSSGFVGWRE